jgi:2-amino-4-hydroxy-6-hydroxymethyldihydropteridine diphosphokinase
MAKCLIGLGSNVGDADSTILAAWQGIAHFRDAQNLKLSSVITSQPAGGPSGQSPFRNAVGLIETSLEPEPLLHQLLELEQTLGRVREQRWGPRSIDLDLLLFDMVELTTPALTLPHPRMAFRRFVLEPAAEIAGDFIYPTNGWSIKQLLEHLDSAEKVLAIVAFDTKVVSDAVRLASERIDLAAQGWTIVSRWPVESSSASTTSLMPDCHCKLVVIVDSPAENSLAANDQRKGWKSFAHRRDVGPVLWLTTSSAALVADEVVAAIAAMR